MTGEELATALKNHLNDLDIEITEKRVNAVYSMGEYFALQVGKEMIESKSLIIATGVTASKTLENEDEFLGRGVATVQPVMHIFARVKMWLLLLIPKKQRKMLCF